MKTKLTIAASLLSAIAVISLLTAAETKTPVSQYDSLKQVTDKFMATVCSGRTKDAYENLFKEWWYKRDEAHDMAVSLAIKYDAMQPQFEDNVGKPLRAGEFEFLGTSRVGKSLVKLVYIEKREYSPVPWLFCFYRADKEWRLVSVIAGDRAQGDLDPLGIYEPAK
jgi:hypothetical protein